MKFHLSIILFLVLSAQMCIAQIRHDSRNYPDNYIDYNGRKQGNWYVYDTDDKLINKITYKNDLPDNTVYYDIKGNEIPLQKTDTEAKPIKANQTINPFNDSKFSAKVFNCSVTVNCLIKVDGTVQEYRLVSDCSKKAQVKILKFIKSFEFQPAKLNGEKVLSQKTFYYGKSF